MIVLNFEILCQTYVHIPGTQTTMSVSPYPSVLMAQRMSSPFMVLRFSREHLSEASPVMKEMNSETHSCIVSLASFEIFALVGNARFMTLPTLAMGKNRSCSRRLDPSSPVGLPPRPSPSLPSPPPACGGCCCACGGAAPPPAAAPAAAA